MSKYRLSIPYGLKIAMRGNPFFRKETCYKFHYQKYAKTIRSDGSIKIGTFSEYRSIEKISIRDEMEGVNKTDIPDNKITTAEDIHKYSLLRSLFEIPDSVKNSSFQAFSVMTRPRDFYTFCFSYDNTNKIYQSLCKDSDPYDCVSKCINIFAVADIICRDHPVLRGYKYLCLPVIYRQRIRAPQEANPPASEQAFEKPLSFSDNKEGRIVFYNENDSPDLPPLPRWESPEIAKLFQSEQLPCQKEGEN